MDYFCSLIKTFLNTKSVALAIVSAILIVRRVGWCSQWVCLALTHRRHDIIYSGAQISILIDSFTSDFFRQRMNFFVISYLRWCIGTVVCAYEIKNWFSGWLWDPVIDVYVCFGSSILSMWLVLIFAMMLKMKFILTTANSSLTHMRCYTLPRRGSLAICHTPRATLVPSLHAQSYTLCGGVYCTAWASCLSILLLLINSTSYNLYFLSQVSVP